jgi:hypothetical protein
MIRHHFVAIKLPDGNYQFFRLKPWLRDHPQFVPLGMDPRSNTSHQLRSALENLGWELRIEPDRVVLFMPDSGAPATLDMAGADMEDEELLQAEEITFGLERDLQKALRANIEQLETGLKISDGGNERSTEAGRIDITAIDKEEKIVVIELKAGTAAPESIAQILSYMGVLAESEGKPTRGILIAGDFHRRTILASHAVPNLELRKYSFQFKFDKVS